MLDVFGRATPEQVMQGILGRGQQNRSRDSLATALGDVCWSACFTWNEVEDRFLVSLLKRHEHYPRSQHRPSANKPKPIR